MKIQLAKLAMLLVLPVSLASGYAADGIKVTTKPTVIYSGIDYADPNTAYLLPHRPAATAQTSSKIARVYYSGTAAQPIYYGTTSNNSKPRAYYPPFTRVDYDW